ncbi:hypothetical protein LTR53_000546 [Teratosphaeriaceae sp. CCFEE 6253]|nr:hypothetical protein LTR53_000546 [Teratosphaeriaceae sp. CCFEE 6253]
MESRPPLDSPLTQQARPDVFEPKVVGLYRRLFTDSHDDDNIPEGFWAELFLLRPDITRLRELLDGTDASTLLHLQDHSHALLLNGIAALKIGRAPADEHALDTLTAFFSVVLGKRYTDPGSDIIEVVAGLDNVDAMFGELVATLDDVIRNETRDASLRLKAVRTAIAVVAGGYQTALVSYFVGRDFFPGIMRLVQQLEDPSNASEPLLLLGLLANHGKFESHNPYGVRFADFVNEEAIRKIADTVRETSDLCRARYIAIQDDAPASWSVAGTLSYVGLGTLAGAKPTQPVLTEEQQRDLFAEQPGPEVAAMLTFYDFVVANKLFCRHIITQQAPDKDRHVPFSAYLSFTSYLHTHAFRSARSASYAYLTLLTLLILSEDPATAKLLCTTSAPVRLCRQRPPLLPAPTIPDRPYATTILDLLTDTLTHNLRKRLDTALYTQTLAVLSRLLTYLTTSRTKLPHHWSELWRALLSLVRFLNQYAADLRTLSGTEAVVRALVDVLAQALSGGEAFLPDAAASDDLFYKLIESGDALTALRDTYALAKPDEKSAAITILVGVSTHYAELIASHRATKNTAHLGPREIQGIIRQGYDTLDLGGVGDEGGGKGGQSRGFREVDHRTELKRIGRVVVGDAVVDVGGSGAV